MGDMPTNLGDYGKSIVNEMARAPSGNRMAIRVLISLAVVLLYAGTKGQTEIYRTARGRNRGRYLGVAVFLGLVVLVQKMIRTYEQEDVLVTDGLHAVARHPHYILLPLLIFGGISLFANSLIPLGGIVIGFIYFAVAVEEEEAALAQRFGSEWAEYAARVPRWGLF